MSDGESNAARQVLIEQANRQAEILERAPSGAVCANHEDLAKGTALSLRLLVGLYQRPSVNGKNGVLGVLAGIGVPTPICILVYTIGHSRGWW